MQNTKPSWDELPLKYGEDGRQYQSLYVRYSHIGCPGYDYEDNCAAPWDCASKGRCRAAYEKEPVTFRDNRAIDPIGRLGLYRDINNGASK